MSNKKAVVIGGGFAGLATASLLARNGLQVTLLEKNEAIGGRARLWKEGGFTFDMGPSWYLMPEVFDRFFSLFDEQRENWYATKELETYYKVFFEPNYSVKITKDLQKTKALFDSFEEYGGEKLEAYLKQAEYKYDIAMREFLYRDYTSVFQFLNRKMLLEGSKLHVFSTLDKFVSRFFSDHRSKKLLEYAMVFLGTHPKSAPALYSIMSHVDLNLGVFFPDGGLGGVAEAMGRLAEEQGVHILTGKEVTRIVTEKGRAVGVQCGNETFQGDVIVSTADYQHTESSLLDKKMKTYKDRYWEKRVLAPSMFIMYLGIGRKLKNLEHHNLFFAREWDDHFTTIFSNPQWPGDPCFYMSCITKTEPDMAPPGGENVFILVPVAPGLEDSDTQREAYADMLLAHVKKITGEDLTKDVLVRRVYSHRDFIQDYNAYKGTALGLAHTLFQTAVFRPARRSKKLENLYYAGQYTHPGVGVPMTLISAEVTADRIIAEVV